MLLHDPKSGTPVPPVTYVALRNVLGLFFSSGFAASAGLSFTVDSQLDTATFGVGMFPFPSVAGRILTPSDRVDLRAAGAAGKMSVVMPFH